MKNKVSYFVRRGGPMEGPFTLVQLQGMWRSGMLTSANEFCIAGVNTWHPLAMLQDTLEADAPPAVTSRPRVVVNHVPSPAIPQWSPGVALVLSFFVPGLGQMYRGKILIGFIALLLVGFLYAVSPLLGLIPHIIVIVTAYAGDPMEKKKPATPGSNLGFLFFLLCAAAIIFALIVKFSK